MKYPDEFETYWKQCNARKYSLPPNDEMIDQERRIKHYVYLGWKNGKQLSEHQLWNERSKGAMSYVLDTKIRDMVDTIVQEASPIFIEAVEEALLETLGERDGKGN